MRVQYGTEEQWTRSKVDNWDQRFKHTYFSMAFLILCCRPGWGREHPMHMAHTVVPHNVSRNQTQPAALIMGYEVHTLLSTAFSSPRLLKTLKQVWHVEVSALVNVTVYANIFNRPWLIFVFRSDLFRCCNMDRMCSSLWHVFNLTASESTHCV